MEFDTAQADKIILKKVAGIDDSSPAMPTEVDLTIPGLMYGKQVEIGSECFKDLAKHNLFLNIKFQEENGVKVKFNPDCSQMFANTTGRESSIQNIDFSGADTSKVTNMSRMFRGCYSLTSLNLSNFDTSNVTDMSWMFQYCENITKLDVSKFDTRQVTNMKRMFDSCKNLKSLDVSKFDTSNVTDMSWMFICCDNLRTLDLKNFNTTNVTDMSRMFELCENLTSLDVSRFNTANVKDMSSMFSRCSNLATLDVSNFNTANVTNMRVMFEDCRNLSFIHFNQNYPLCNLVDMSDMFRNCVSLSDLTLPKFETNVKTDNMFENCISLGAIPNGSELPIIQQDTCGAINMIETMSYPEKRKKQLLKLPHFFVGSKVTLDLITKHLWEELDTETCFDTDFDAENLNINFTKCGNSIKSEVASHFWKNYTSNRQQEMVPSMVVGFDFNLDKVKMELDRLNCNMKKNSKITGRNSRKNWKK